MIHNEDDWDFDDDHGWSPILVREREVDVDEDDMTWTVLVEQERDGIEDEWRSVRVNGATYPDASADQVPEAIKVKAMQNAEKEMAQ